MLVKLAQEAAAETAENYHVILGRVASGDKFIGTKEGKEHIKKYVQGTVRKWRVRRLPMPVG